jgi:hypothetical protein
MYLQRLYKHHKGWFIFVLLFALGQLFICLRRGVVCTPFYQYGMYSAAEKPPQEAHSLWIMVDSQELNATQMSPSRWDAIAGPIHRYEGAYYWNDQLWKLNIHRILGVTDSVPYLSQDISKDQFLGWYATYLSSVLHKPVHKVRYGDMDILWMEKPKQ